MSSSDEKQLLLEFLESIGLPVHNDDAIASDTKPGKLILAIVKRSIEDDKNREGKEWSIDCASAEHCTGSWELLEAREPCSQEFTNANGGIKISKWKGTVTLGSLQLRNVYYHETFGNLISASKLINQKHWSIQLLEDKYVINSHGKLNIEEDLQSVAAIGRRCGGHYILESVPPVVIKQSPAVVGSEENLWLKEMSTSLEVLDLIPSTNLTSQSVLEVLGSRMTNAYTDDYAGDMYQAEAPLLQFKDLGFEVEGALLVESESNSRPIHVSKRLCEVRALSLFGLKSERWGDSAEGAISCSSGAYIYMPFLTSPVVTIFSSSLAVLSSIIQISLKSLIEHLCSSVNFPTDRTFGKCSR